MTFKDLQNGSIFKESYSSGGERPIFIKSDGEAINLQDGTRQDFHWNKKVDPLIMEGNFSLAKFHDETILVKRLNKQRYIGYFIFPYGFMDLRASEITFLEGNGRESQEQVYIMLRRAKLWVENASEMLRTIERVVEEGMRDHEGLHNASESITDTQKHIID